MAIKLEFYRIIIPRRTIIDKYPGGWEGCLADHQGSLGGSVEYDQHLFSDGAMNPVDIDILADKWEDLGFTSFIGDTSNGRWIDFCVCDMIFGPLNCDWLVRDGQYVYFKGTEPAAPAK